MNTGGFSIANYHDGNTTIEGNLNVAGNVFVGSTTGQSEYLDSGDYKTIITPQTGWSSITALSTRYAKNGNIVQVYSKLQGNILSNQTTLTLTLTVPGFDLFGVLPITGTDIAYISSVILTSDGSIYTGTILSLFANTSTAVASLYYRKTTAIFAPVNVEFDLLITYKLVGDDIPATVLIAGGGGGGGSGVRNPMLENLDGGGFNLFNFGNVQATSFNGSQILTNPLTSTFNANLNDITNVASIKTLSVQSGIPNTPVIFGSDLDVDFNDIKNAQTVNCVNVQGVDSLLLSATDRVTLQSTSINPLENQIEIKSPMVFVPGLDIKGLGNLALNSMESTAGSVIIVQNDLAMAQNSIFDIKNVQTNSLQANTGNINLLSNIFMGNVTSLLDFDFIRGNTVATSVIQGRTGDIKLLNTINAQLRDIINLNNLRTNSLQSNTGNINLLSDIDVANKNLVNFNSIYGNTVFTNILQGTTGDIDIKSPVVFTPSGVLNIKGLGNLALNSMESTFGSIIIVQNDFAMAQNSIFDIKNVKTNSLQANAGNINLLSGINMNSNNISNAGTISATSLSTSLIDAPGTLTIRAGDTLIFESINAQLIDFKSSADFTGNNVYNIQQVSAIELVARDLKNDTLGQSLTVSSNLDMKLNNIENVGTLTTTDLKSPQINGITYVRTASDLPASLNGVYVICGDIVLTNTTTYTVTGPTSIIGYGYDRSSLYFNNTTASAGNCIVCTDQSLSFINVRISNQSTQYNLLSANNVAKDKKIVVLNSLFTLCKNSYALSINGFDLVDFNQVVCEFNTTTVNLILINGADKCQISNCTVYKSTNLLSACPLLEFNGVCGQVNVSGSLFVPAGAQDGIRLNPSMTTTAMVISGNTFFDGGLTTGFLLNYTQRIELIVSNNSGILDLKAILAGESRDNVTFSPTVAVTWESIIFGPAFAVTSMIRFIASPTPYEFIYNSKKPIYAVIFGTISADHGTGGSDICLVTVLKNGVPTSSVIQITLAQGTSETFTYNTVTSLVYGDALRFSVQNTTAGTSAQGFRALSANIQLNEI